MKKLIILALVILFFLNSIRVTHAETILQTDFSNGTIDPFTYWSNGNAYYRVLSPSEDPLGTGEWSVELNYPTDVSGRSSLLYHSSGYQDVNISLYWMTPYANDTDWTHVFNIEYWEDSLKEGEFLTMDVYHSQWRINYYEKGTTDYQTYVGSVKPNTKYFIKARVKLGYTDGEVEISVDNTTIFSKQGLDNARLAGEINAYEVGCFWGKDLKVYIYDVKMEGAKYNFTLVNVTGRVVDEQGNPIPMVGIRVGSPPPKDKPWSTHTYYDNLYTDSNGYFSFQHPETVIPEIKFIKPGYGDPNEAVGSITRLKNINLTGINGTYNLGNITLHSRPVIQPTVRPNGTYWPFRSVVIFPYQHKYSSQGYLDTLDALKNSFGNRFNTIDLRCYTSLNESGMPFCDGLYSFSELAVGIRGAHEKGFKVMLSLVGHVNSGDEFNPKWWASYKELLLKMAELGSNYSVEYFTIAFETRPFYYPENDEKKFEILEALKVYLDSHPEWNPKIGYIGIENVANLTYVEQTAGWLQHPLIDYVGIEDWRRKAGILDPTEENISQAWRYGISWDWKPDPPDIYQVYDGIIEFLKKPIIVNFGSGTGDGNCWAPYISGYRPNVQDQEEMALFYKVYFDHMQNLPFYGVAMEHYSFAPSNTTITGCFRETIAEDFIKFGLDAHSQNFSTISGKIEDKEGNPLKSSVYIYQKGSDILKDNDRTDLNGNYRVETTPGIYDVFYNFTEFQGLSIKLASVDLRNNLYNPINYLTKSKSKVSFIVNASTYTLKVHSDKKPLRVKINGAEIQTWSYNETSKMLSINLSVITAKSGYPEDIQDAVNLVESMGGGTVYIPAGDWVINQSSGSAINIDLETLPEGAWLNIIGSQDVVTTTTQNGVTITAPATILRQGVIPSGYFSTFSITGSNTSYPANFNYIRSKNRHIRISRLTILNYVTNDSSDANQNNAGIVLKFVDGFLIDDVFIDSNTNAGISVQASKGVISNCSITQYYHKVLGPMSGWGYGVAVFGNSQFWASNLGTATWIINIDDVIGKYDWQGIPLQYHNPQVILYNELYGKNYQDTHGSTNNISYTAGPVYVEDCFFDYTRHPVSSAQYGYYVLRNSVIKHPLGGLQSIDIHGRPFPSGRYAEIYNNTLDNVVIGVAFRGGGGLVFNNTFINNNVDVQLANEYYNASEYDPQYIDNVWIWNNTHTGTGSPLNVWANQNITPGVNYFTDSWGGLINSTTPSPPKPNYTPYPYPHPLTQEE